MLFSIFVYQIIINQNKKMKDLKLLLKQNEFNVINTKNVYQKKLRESFYIFETSMYNDSIAYFRILNYIEYIDIQFIGIISEENFVKICDIAHNITGLVQRSLLKGIENSTELNNILEKEYSKEWILSKGHK